MASFLHNRRQKKRLDPSWRMAVGKALEELDLDCVSVNETLMFRSKLDRDKVKALAESLHPELYQRYGLKPPKRCPVCQKKMFVKLARRGSTKGKHFWGCSGYPDCRYTEDFSGEAENRHQKFRKRMGR